MKLRCLAVSLLILTPPACAAPPGPVPSAAHCPATRPREAQPLDSAHVLALAGTYQLVSVATSRGLVGVTDSGRLELAPSDTLRRYYRQRMFKPVRSGDRPLVGTYDVSDHRFVPQEAEIEAGTLYVGCRECNDGSPWIHRIEAVAPWGFWGHWEDRQTGIGRRYDSLQHPLPNPSGYYCAWRLAAPVGASSERLR